MPVFNNILAGAAGSGGAAGYKVERSLRFNPDDNGHLTKLFTTAGNRRKFTLSYWIKESGKGTSPSNNPHILWSGTDVNTRGGFVHRGTGTDANKIYLFNQESNSTNCAVYSNSLHRDFSAWKHIVWAVDTTQSTATNRVKLYVNGVQETLNFVTTPAQNLELQINRNQQHRIGRGFPDDYGNYMLAEMYFVDGQQINPVNVFGEFDEDTGVWNPIEYTGTYGTNGFHLDFSDNSTNRTLGLDARVEGTRYSIDWSGTLANNYTFATLFDGNVSTLCLGANASTLTWTPATPIAWTDAAGGVEVYYHNTSSPDKARINDGSWVNQANNSGGWEKVSTGDGTLTKLELEDQVGSEVAVYAIRVNGTILTDPAGANDWTVNNLTSKAGVTITSAKIYSSYNGATVSSNYSVQWSDDNSNWTTAFSGVMSNNGQCGIQTGTNPGNGSYGAHKYWKLLIGSVIASHWPRSSRILLSDGANDYAVRTFTSDNCSDSGGIPQNGDSYTYTSPIGPESIDSLIDSPTDYEVASGNNGGNYCVLNPLTTTGGNSGTSNGILSQGNLRLTNPGSNTWSVETGTIGVSAGKWYYEYVCSGTITNFLGGWADPREVNYNDAVGNTARSYGYYATGNVRNSNNNTGFGASYTAGDIIGCAIDIDNRKIWWSKNGSWQVYDPNAASGAGNYGSVFTIQDPVANGFVYTPAVSTYDANSSVDVNFGQRPFKYPPGGTGGPPSSYKSLCTKNLDDPLIADGSTQFDTRLYSGNGGTQSIGAPVYSAASTMSSPTQAFNGSVSNGAVFSNASVLTAASITITSSLEIYHNRTGSNGITVNINGTDYTATGLSSAGYHTIPIPAGSLPLTSTGNITVTDNDGSSTLYAVRVDGNVLVDGTGASLSFKPDWTWIKNRNGGHNHMLYDSVRGPGLDLMSNGTQSENQGGSNDLTSFDSSGFSLGSNNAVNQSGRTYVAWNWNAADSNTQISAGSLNSSVYNQSRQWGSDIQTGGGGISFDFRTFNGATDHGYYTVSDVTWITNATEYTNLSGRLKVMNSSSSTITMTFRNAQNQGVNSVNVPAGGTTYYDTGMDWLTTWKSVVFTGGTLPAIIQIGGKDLVNTSVTPTNVPAIASTVRANPTAGFSIVSWTGNSGIKQTIGHGLNAAPEMIIAKNRDSSIRWAVYHKSEGPGNTLVLNSNGTPTGGTGVWGNIYPTSSVFTVSNDAETNASSNDYIAYCISPVDGYSAVGLYVGNGSANGPFIHTGFRPAFIIIKSLTGTGHWRTYDSTRKTYNVIDNSLHLSTTEDESAYSNDEIDFLSNGFKPRAVGSFHNGNGTNYIYYAVAENPFKLARAR